MWDTDAGNPSLMYSRWWTLCDNLVDKSLEGFQCTTRAIVIVGRDIFSPWIMNDIKESCSTNYASKNNGSHNFYVVIRLTAKGILYR